MGLGLFSWTMRLSLPSHRFAGGSRDTDMAVPVMVSRQVLIDTVLKSLSVPGMAWVKPRDTRPRAFLDGVYRRRSTDKYDAALGLDLEAAVEVHAAANAVLIPDHHAPLLSLLRCPRHDFINVLVVQIFCEQSEMPAHERRHGASGSGFGNEPCRLSRAADE